MSDDIRAAIASATKSVTKTWKQAKRQADRTDRVSSARIARLRFAPPRVTIREVAFDVMEDAYNKASGNGRYYANARQIMYAARPAILAECDATQFNDVYFTQTLLKDYLEEYEPGWKVVWDARGNLIEPHTNERVAIGGVGVANYMKDWRTEVSRDLPEIKHRIRTKGPSLRFANVLFIEKEGFTEILMDAGIGKRFDMAIMSTKGLPVGAACELINRMECEGVRIFVLRDFDLAGFKIVRTLELGTRLAPGTNVTDLGLRLGDIDGLEAEPVDYRQSKNPRYYLLEQCGATEEEAEFLVSDGGYRGWSGQRVEINAMTSEELIEWLERKFEEHGVEKFIPDEGTLKEAFQRAIFLQRIEEKLDAIEEEVKEGKDEVSIELAAKVETKLKEDKSSSWDDVVWSLAEDGDDDDD